MNLGINWFQRSINTLNANRMESKKFLQDK